MKFENFETDDPNKVIIEAARRYAEELEYKIDESVCNGQNESAHYMQEELKELSSVLETL